jgi:hypothetical protein
MLDPLLLSVNVGFISFSGTQDSEYEHSESELAFLLEALTKAVELTHEESKKSRNAKM